MKGIIGRKVGMTQLFTEDGNVVPVTIVEAGPCTVVQKKTVDHDGYEAIQVGYEDVSEKRVNKPIKGHFDKAELPYQRYLREFRFEGVADMNVGDVIDAGMFEIGQKVDVTGTSKGKGFAGAVKRWGSASNKMSHGGGPVHRSPGSLGSSSSPSRVFKGKKLAGRMGHDRVTIQNLDVVKVDAEKALLAIKGAIPGPKGGLVIIKQAVKG